MPLSGMRGWESPLIGRQMELDTLRRAFSSAGQLSRCQLVTVIGEPGVGKSRLASELADSLGSGATVLRTACRPFTEGLSYWPLRELVRQRARLGPGDPFELAEGRLAAMLGPDGRAVAERVVGAIELAERAFPPEEVFWAMRKTLEHAASRRPLLVVVDDAHWAEAALIELLEYLPRAAPAAPILILCLANPDPALGAPLTEGGERAGSVTLGPLREFDARVLAERLLTFAELPTERAAQVAEAAAGSPLLVEHAVGLLGDAGDSSSLRLPAEVDELILERLERLDKSARGLLERMSVAGEEVPVGALAALADDVAERELELLALKGFVRRVDRDSSARDAYRFTHASVRDNAYQRLTEATRWDLHVRFARWVEDSAPVVTGAVEVIAAHHLEQALRAGEPPDEGDERQAALAAADRLARVGRRAHAGGDIEAAANLLDRAVALVPQGETPPDLMLELGLALSEVGDVPQADAVLSDAAAAGRAAGDTRVELNSLLERADVRTSVRPERSAGELRRLAEQAIPVLWELGDEHGLARAWRNLSDSHLLACRYGAAAESLERALVHAERARDSRVQAQIASELAMTLLYGPVSAEVAIARLHGTLGRVREEQGQARSNGFVGLTTRVEVEAFGLARLEAMRANFDEARALCARAREVYEELGDDARLAGLGLVSGTVELIAGAAEPAEHDIRTSYERFEQMGEGSALSAAAGLLADANLALGRERDAGELAELAEQLADPTDVLSQVGWRITRARLLAREGKARRAEALAREALELADTTDFLNVQGDARVALAETLGLAARASEAAPVASTALDLYQEKGNVVAARRALSLLEALA